MTPENTLAQVRYCDWDVMRGALYDVFGWYMQHLYQIEELSQYENMTPDVFVIECLNHGLETYRDRYENVTRGDRI